MLAIKDKQEASSLMIMIMALAGIFLMAFGAAYLVFFSVRSSDMKNNAVKARYAAESCLQEFEYQLSSRYFLDNGTTIDIAALCPLATSMSLMSNDVLANRLSCQVDCDSTGTTSEFVISGRSTDAVYKITKPYISELLSSWRMNEHNLTTDDGWDSSGHGYLLTPTGGILTDINVVHPSFIYSTNFATSTEYLGAGNIVFNDPQDWSISFWAYTVATGTLSYTVLSNINGYATNTINIIDGDSFSAYLNIGGSDVNAVFKNAGPTMSLYNAWHNFVISYDGISLLAYVDGTLFGDAYFSSNNLSSGSDNLIIGQNFVGNLDELRLYNRALTAAEAQLLYKYLLLY